MSQTILKDAALKSTKKRRLLLSILQTQNKPMTAEELLEQSNPILPMNLSTIYRTLNIFTENGILSKTLRKDGKAYFALAKHDHTHHLICTVCQKIIPIEHCPLQELQEDLQQKTGFHITGHLLEFCGICADCLQKNHAENEKEKSD